MQQRRQGKGVRSCPERQYLLVKAAAVLLMLCSVMTLLPDSQRYGANGVLHVHGVLAESACRLEMASA